MNAKNKEEETALHVACQVGSIDIIKTLLNSEIDINSFNNKKETPLLQAVKNNNLNVVKGRNIQMFQQHIPLLIYSTC